jgi:hypothetical protein
VSAATEAERNAAAWRDEARRLRAEGEYLCSAAGRRFDEAADADAQAEFWQRRVDARERELSDLDAKVDS